jgi:hypothetical protein
LQGRDANKRLQRAIRAGKLRERLPSLIEELRVLLAEWKEGEGEVCVRVCCLLLLWCLEARGRWRLVHNLQTACCHGIHNTYPQHPHIAMARRSCLTAATMSLRCWTGWHCRWPRLQPRARPRRRR